MTNDHFPCELCFMPVTDELEDVKIIENSSAKCKILTQEIIDECGNQPWLNFGMLAICEPNTENPVYLSGFFAFCKVVPVKFWNDQICDEQGHVQKIYQREGPKMFLFHQRCFAALQKLEKNHYLLNPKYHGCVIDHMSAKHRYEFCKDSLARFNNFKRENRGPYVSFDFQLSLFHEAKRHGMEHCLKDPLYNEENKKRIVELVKKFY